MQPDFHSEHDNQGDQDLDKKRIKEITIIHSRRQSIKKTVTTAAENCPICGCADLITAPSAILLTGVSESTLDGWIKNYFVHTNQSPNGTLRLCCQSLSEQVASCNREIKKTIA